MTEARQGVDMLSPAGNPQTCRIRALVMPQPIYFLSPQLPLVILMADESDKSTQPAQPAQPAPQPAPEPAPRTVVIKEKKGWGLGTRILLWLIAIVVILAVLAFLTISISVLDQPAGSSFPFTTTYRVSLPDGEPVTIGNSRIIVLTMGNEVDTSVDGSKERLAIGQERTISARYARISALGIPIMDTDFQIVLKYIGPSGSNALFDMRIMTSRQVPELLIRNIIPPGMGAQPI